jgi:hypothetical protein
MNIRRENALKNMAILLLVILAIWLGFRHPKTAPAPEPENSAQAPANTSSGISITKEKITEANFSGSRPVITGGGDLADAARSFVDKTLSDFKTQADKEVPDIKAHFGADEPAAMYTLDIDAKDIKGPKTESIVLVEDIYTGGANDNEVFKVFTASLASGKLLDLSDVIKTSQQAPFTELVKKELDAWQPSGTTAPVVFTDEVDSLKFSDFTDWSLDSQNLTLYFSKYAIGPGVLGAVPFTISLDKLSDMLAI